MRACLLAVLLIAAAASTSPRLAAAPEDAKVTPGEFVIEHPTLINLGFEWHIDGDANRNASVDFIRNIAYHAPGGSTRLTAGSPGVFFYNNTILTETNGGASANVHWRNNLMLGQNTQAAIFSVNTNTTYSSSDYNGFRPNSGSESFQWNSPPSSVPAILADGTSATKLETRKFATLEAYAQATQQDRHSVLVDYDIFMKVSKLDAKDLATVQRLYEAKDLDFSLRPGSAAVDRGVALPNVTDGFTGQAPDLGALEVGRPMPVYGPRPR